MEEIKEKQIIAQCYHCGNKGLMNVVSVHKEQFGGTTVDETGELDVELEETFFWFTLSCPVCKFITLMQKYTNECYYNPGTNTVLYDDEIIYPENKMNLKNVPKNIATSFEAALKISNINSDLTLMSLRKTLELICNDMNAKGDDLDTKIKSLIKDKIFPIEFEDAYWIIRQLGNKAAHSDNTGVHNYDVKEIINLLYTIINYLYVTPGKIKYLKEKLQKESK
jgi:hypothetical protein